VADRTVKRGPPGSDAEAEQTATSGAWTEDRSGDGTVIPRAPLTSGLAVVPSDHYQRGEEYARGGLGRIVRGRDRRLGRPVAIKELLRETPMTRARFAREAQITARLQHPGVVPIYEAGVWPSGQPFYAMRLVAGRPLSAAITDAATLTERLGLLSRVLVVCETMAYAHSQDVIHRDLKPSNILVGEYGETVVIDWGIAKDLGVPDEDAADIIAPVVPDLTQEGQVMGTPWYMAPEQARGEITGKPADVYALGAILYHLLAGKPPHGETPGVVQAVAAGVPPPPLTTRVEGVPPDLVAIVDKALAAEAEHRYPTAAELADDLRRFLAGQLVSVHRYTVPMLVRRWVARHKAAVAIGAAAAAALLVVGAISIVNVVAARDEARRQQAVATTRADELAKQRDDLILTQAEGVLDRDPTAALTWLKKYPDSGADWPRARSIAADAQSRGVARHVLGHGEEVYAARPSADGSTLAAAGHDTIVIRDAASGVVRASFRLASARLVAVSANGSRVAAVGLEDRDVRLWSAGGGVVRLAGHGGPVVELAISPDGERVVAVGADGSVLAWRGPEPARVVRPAGAAPHALFEDTRHVATIDDGVLRVLDTDGGAGWTVGGTRGVTALAVSPDGATIATAGDEVSLWPVRGGAPRRLPPSAGVLGIGFAGNETLAAIAADAAIRVWRVRDGRESRLVRESVSDWIGLSPKGWIASGSATGAIRLWRPDVDLASYDQQSLLGHRARVSDLQFSSDGARLISGSNDSDVRVWELAAAPFTRRRATAGGLYQLAYVDGGRSIIATASTGEVLRIDPSSGAVSVLGRHGREAYALAVSRDGTLAVTSAFDGSIALWDLPSGAEHRLQAAGASSTALAISADNRWVAEGSDEGLLLGPTRGPLLPLPGHDGAIEFVAFSPDSSLLASAGADSTVRLWMVADRQGLHVLRGHTNKATRPTFTPDGRTLVAGDFDGNVRAWDVASGAGRLLGKHPGPIRAIAIAPDGTTVASSSRDGLVRLWRLTSGEGRDLGRHRGAARDVAFSPDGTQLATASWDGTIRLWDVADGSSAPLRIGANVQRVAFRGDGGELAATVADGSLITVPLPSTATVPAGPVALRTWLGQRTTD
jgi:WD40 repeat protein